MVDTTFNKVFHNVWNYTKEHWYNFRSYISGTEPSQSICNNCNSINDVYIMCDCFGYNKTIVSDCGYIVNEVSDYREVNLQHSIVF